MTCYIFMTPFIYLADCSTLCEALGRYDFFCEEENINQTDETLYDDVWWDRLRRKTQNVKITEVLNSM